MSVFYKANDNKQHKTQLYHKANDDRWHYVKNVYTKQSDNKWHPVYTYDWMPSAWSACSKTCGGGTQTRTVICVRNDNISRPDVFCDGISKPTTIQDCNMRLCDIPINELKECNIWSTILFKNGKAIVRNGNLQVANVNDVWEGPGYYYVGVAVLFTAHYYQNKRYWAELTFTINRPDTGVRSSMVMLTTRNTRNYVTVSNAVSKNGANQWQGIRQDILDGDGEGYYQHYWLYNSFFIKDKIWLATRPSYFYVNFVLTGDKNETHDGRMCAQRTYILKALE